MGVVEPWKGIFEVFATYDWYLASETSFVCNRRQPFGFLAPSRLLLSQICSISGLEVIGGA